MAHLACFNCGTPVTEDALDEVSQTYVCGKKACQERLTLLVASGTRDGAEFDDIDTLDEEDEFEINDVEN